MKNLLGVLVLGLFLITPTQADDISDFQIEGMSVEDSLLDYVSKEKILSRKRFFGEGKKYINKEYSSYYFSSHELNLQSYEMILVEFKSNDPKYIIMSITGRKFFNDVKDCYKEQKKIEFEFDSFFKNVIKLPRTTTSYSGDKTGKSKVTHISFFFNDGSSVQTMCYKWSKERLKINLKHRLSISINTSKYLDWNVSWFEKFRETE